MREILLVRLHRCKSCGVRMFEHDRRGHLIRHGIGCDDIPGHFEPGPKDTPQLAGGNYRPIKQPARKKKASRKKPEKKGKRRG